MVGKRDPSRIEGQPKKIGSPATLLDRTRGLAMALFAGALVYASYFPSDSVAVERGDALWLAVIGIVTAMVAWVMPTFTSSDAGRRPYLIDVLAMSLAAWMMVAALGISGSGNLRQSTNEAWLWVTAAAMFTASRRILIDATMQRAALVLLVGCTIAQSVQGLHQHFVSLPRTLAQYRADPDAMLRLAGIDAPPGSATRMVFENRLLDGGPVGTFALANSLAAVQVLGLVIIAATVMVHWHRLTLVGRAVSIAMVSLVLTSLVFTHSRSGLLAAIVGIGIAGMLVMSRRWLIFAAGGFVAFVVAIMSLALFGKEEWIAQAPSSIAFRFQYWRSTWKLVLDRPLFGAGPGNFQAVYPRYREPSAAESIAEPHNFFFETLAAGGFVAVALLVVLIVAIAYASQSRRRERPSDDSTGMPGKLTQRDHDEARWWWVGGSGALVLIWLLGLATGQPPDWQAQIWALPIAIVSMVMAWRATMFCDNDPQWQSHLGVIRVAAVAAIMLHLVASGGFTVPGVAIWIWMVAGMMAPAAEPLADQMAQPWGSRREARERLAAVGVGLALLMALRLVSIGPVEAAASLTRQATIAPPDRRIELVERASQVDPWSPDAPLWLADMYHWSVIDQPTNVELRRRWRATVEDAILRSGSEPSLIRLAATGPLHVFQRWGRDEDLQWSLQLLNLACDVSPTDAAFFAQRAEIAERMGDERRAVQDARIASELAELGENLERRLWLQPILVVENFGEAAQREPIFETADKLLENQLDISDVQRDNR